MSFNPDVYLQQTMTSFGNCINCGVPIYGPDNKKQYAIANPGFSNSFFCINGHSQHYVGKSDAQKLKEAQEEVARQRDRAEREERQKRAARTELKNVKTRVSNGVCPCCNRSFENLGRHMKTKHADYLKQDIGT